MEERDHGANKREREEDDTTVEGPEKKALVLKGTEASGKKIFPNPAKKTFPRVPSSATTPSTGGGSIAIPTPESISTSKKVKEVIPHPAVMKDADFYKFGDQSKTDKIFHHAYHRFYPRFIEHYRKLPDKGMAMLEIGLESMKSIPLWTNYFPKAFIYGIDIGFSEIGDRYRIFQADQSDRSKLEDIVKNKINKAIFLIVDDGSHVPEHQVLSFDYLFEHLLLPGGTYIVEDIETSYWRKNGLYGYETRYGYRHTNSAIEIFKNLVDDVNSEFLNGTARDEHDSRLRGHFCKNTRSMVSTVNFGMNNIIITKKTTEEMEFSKRQYRYERNL